MPRKERTEKLENGEEGVDFVRCELCGQHLRQVDSRHLRAFHQEMDPRVYEIRYPNSPRVCEGARRLYREQIEIALPLETREIGLRNSLLLGQPPPDETARELMSVRKRIAKEREMEIVQSEFEKIGLVPLGKLSKDLGIPIRTLYSASKGDRLPVEKVEGAGRIYLGSAVESVKTAIVTGKMKPRK